MAGQQIDLLSLFGQASQTLKKNQTSLNKADSYNHDHGDNMVEVFDVITQAMKEKENADPADQLEYAAQLLRNKTKSGSGAVYADGLHNAAKQVGGKELNTGTIMTIIETLMGSAKQPGQQPTTARRTEGICLVRCWAHYSAAQAAAVPAAAAQTMGLT